MIEIDLNNFSQEGAPKYDLKNYINSYFTKQYSVLCSACQNQASVQYKIFNNSQILIIHIYRQDPSKNHKTEINLDIKLDISNYIYKYDKVFPNKEFCLKGYISFDEKIGYFFDFNYKTYKDNFKWKRYSNEGYTDINIENINNIKPILLFYEATDASKIIKQKIEDSISAQIKTLQNNQNISNQGQNFVNINNNNMNNSNMSNNSNQMCNNMNNPMSNNNNAYNSQNNMNNNMQNPMNNNMSNYQNTMTNYNNMSTGVNPMNNNMNQQFNNNSFNHQTMAMNPMMQNNVNNQNILQMQKMQQFQQMKQIQQMQQIQQMHQMQQIQQQMQIMQQQQMEQRQNALLQNCNDILNSVGQPTNNNLSKEVDKNNIKIIFKLFEEGKEDENNSLSSLDMYINKTEKMNSIFVKYMTKLQKKKEDNYIKKFTFNGQEISMTSTQSAEELQLKNNSSIKVIKNKNAV